MCWPVDNLWRKGLGGTLALALLALLPLQAPAAGIGFRNETNSPIVVQGATFVGGMLRRGQALVIYPNRSALDQRLPLGTRLITIYDGNQPNRLLLRERVEFRGQDLLFRVRQVPGGGVQLQPANPGGQ
jgi:hypothetical protein